MLIFIGAQPVFGTVTFIASPGTQTVDLGSTFTETFTATTTAEAFEGFDLYLGTNVQDANLFTVTGDSLGSQFQFIVSGGPALPDSLSTSSSQDFGQSETTTLTDLAAGGPYTLATLTIEAQNGLSLGDHTLTILPDSAVYDSSFNTNDISGSPEFTVDVVPEPGAASLLTAGLLGCLLFSPRMRRLARLPGPLVGRS